LVQKSSSPHTSCSVAIWNTGRDPAPLVGKSRASIHAEFGKPATTKARLIGPIDYHRVKGSWKNADVANTIFIVDVFTLCALEPYFTFGAAASKSARTENGQYLLLEYHDETVVGVGLDSEIR